MGASQDLRVEFDGTTMPITLATSGANITATRNGQTLGPFGGVNSIVVLGTGNDDALQINGPVTPPLGFPSGNGHDSLAVLSGNYIIPADLDSDGIWNIDLSIAAGASASFAGNEHFHNATLTGDANVAPGGGKVLVVTASRWDPTPPRSGGQQSRRGLQHPQPARFWSGSRRRHHGPDRLRPQRRRLEREGDRHHHRRRQFPHPRRRQRLRCLRRGRWCWDPGCGRRVHPGEVHLAAMPTSTGS
jgi:hypothetical protein